jgi:hypothetical protein
LFKSNASLVRGVLELNIIIILETKLPASSPLLRLNICSNRVGFKLGYALIGIEWISRIASAITLCRETKRLACSKVIARDFEGLL